MRIFIQLNSFFFFFNDTATTEIYTLSYTTLFRSEKRRGISIYSNRNASKQFLSVEIHKQRLQELDRKSTRLNSSHVAISYAVFCLKKKKKKKKKKNKNNIKTITEQRQKY